MITHISNRMKSVVLSILALTGALTLISYFTVTFLYGLLHDNAQKAFLAAANEITAAITDGLQSITTSVEVAAAGIESLYSYSSKKSPIPQSYFTPIMQGIIDNTNFQVFAVNFVRFVNTTYDLVDWLEINRQIYNLSSMSPFEINESGIVRLINVSQLTPNDLPMALMSQVYPNRGLTGVPTIGLWNIRPNDPQIIDSLWLLPVAAYNPSIVTTTRLTTGSLTVLSVAIKTPFPWLGFVVLNPTDFLDRILSKYSHITLSVADEAGIFYRTGGLTTKYRNVQKIAFPYRIWTIVYLGDDSYDSNDSAIIVVVSLLVVLYVIIVLGGLCLLHYKRRKAELDRLQSQRLQYHTQHYIFHQIRNILTAPNMILEYGTNHPEPHQINMSLTDGDIIVLKSSVSQCVNLATQVMVFDQLFRGKYNPVYERVSLRSLLTQGALMHMSPVTIYCNGSVDEILVDVTKFSEIFANGYANACRHRDDTGIMVCVQILETEKQKTLLIVEIFNRCNTVIPQTRSFIPAFMDTDIWSKEDLVIFEQDATTESQVRPYLRDFPGPFRGGTEEIIVARETHESRCCQDTSSFGVGLSMARLIAKTFRGDVGLETVGDYVRFWFALSLSPPKSVDTSV